MTGLALGRVVDGGSNDGESADTNWLQQESTIAVGHGGLHGNSYGDRNHYGVQKGIDAQGRSPITVPPDSIQISSFLRSIKTLRPTRTTPGNPGGSSRAMSYSVETGMYPVSSRTAGSRIGTKRRRAATRSGTPILAPNRGPPSCSAWGFEWPRYLLAESGRSACMVRMTEAGPYG